MTSKNCANFDPGRTEETTCYGCFNRITSGLKFPTPGDWCRNFNLVEKTNPKKLYVAFHLKQYDIGYEHEEFNGVVLEIDFAIDGREAIQKIEDLIARKCSLTRGDFHGYTIAILNWKMLD